MKKLLLAGIAASMVCTIAAHAADDDPPPPPRFRPWQQVWQCNDIRVTVTARDPFSIEYDLGGTIWGGGHFTVIKGALYFNERPCLPLQPIGYDASTPATFRRLAERDREESRGRDQSGRERSRCDRVEAQHH